MLSNFWEFWKLFSSAIKWCFGDKGSVEPALEFRQWISFQSDDRDDVGSVTVNFVNYLQKWCSPVPARQLYIWSLYSGQEVRWCDTEWLWTPILSEFPTWKAAKSHHQISFCSFASTNFTCLWWVMLHLVWPVLFLLLWFNPLEKKKKERKIQT